MNRPVNRLWASLLVVIACLGIVSFGWADDDKPAKDEKKEDKKEWSASGASSAVPDKPKAASVTDSLPCSACHTTAGWKSKDVTGDEPGATKFDHSKTGFPLTGQHTKTPCVGCHDGKRQIKRMCITCHADAHRGRLAETCDKCHTPAGWRQTRALEMHRMTRFPLTGMHVLTDCTECHRRASEHQWTGAPVDCFACHEKDYNRKDLHPVHNGSVAGNNQFPRDCSLCHRAIAWAPAKFDANLITGNSALPLKVGPPANHDVKFPISFGVHRGASCEDCHAQMAVPRLVRCTGCHAHDTVRLAAQHKQTTSPLASSCLSCHPAGIRR
jgi:hypothetical protein